MDGFMKERELGGREEKRPEKGWVKSEGWIGGNCSVEKKGLLMRDRP